MRKVALYLLTFVASFTLTVVGLTQVGVVKKRCFLMIQHKVEEYTGVHISAGKFKMLGPFALRCYNITLYGDSTEVHADKMDLTINPLSLFNGKIECPYLSIEKLKCNEWFPVDVSGSLEINALLRGKGEFHLVWDGGSATFQDVYFDRKGVQGLYSHDFLCQGEGEFTYKYASEVIEASGHCRVSELPEHSQIEWGKDVELSYIVEGTLSTPEISIIAKEEELHLGYLDLNALELQTDIVMSGESLFLEAHLEGKIEEMPFRVRAKAGWEGQELVKLEDFSLEIPELSGTGSVLYDVENRVVQGNINLVTAQIQETFPETDLDFEGHLIGRISLVASLDENYLPVDPSIEVNVDSNGFTLGSFRGRDVELSLEMNGFSHFKGSLLASECGAASETIKDFKGSFSFVEETLSPFSLEGLYEGEKFVFNGLAEAAEGELKCFLDQCEGVYCKIPFGKEQGGYFSISEKGILFDGLHLNYGKSNLNLQGHYADEELLIYSTSNHVDLEELTQGKVMGIGQYKLTLQGPLDNLECKAALHVDHFNVENYSDEKVLPLSGNLQIALAENTLSVNGDFNGIGDEVIQVTGKLPFHLSLFPSSVVIPFDQQLTGKVVVKGEISPYLGFFLSDTTSVTGEGQLEIFCSGTLMDPTFSGNLVIHDGTYESLVLGSIFYNIEGKIELEGNQLVIQSLQGIDSKGGVVKGEGYLSLDPEEHYPFDIALDIQASQLLNLDYADCLTTGQIHFKGTSDAGLLTGELNIIGGTVTLPDETPALLNTVEVEYINQPDNERAPTMCVNGEDPWPVKLDITLNIPQGIDVGANNWKSSWRGNLELRGSTDDPLIYGQGKIVQGEFLFNGKTLLSEEGAIYFSGEPGRKTTLYIVAREEIDNLKIEVIIKGPIKSPELAFRSNPPKTTREILSYLLFHRGLGDITPLEGEELTHHIIKLNDTVAEGPSLLDKLKTSFGIDRLDIEGEGDQDPDDVSVRVGKYLTRRFFLSLKKSMGDKPNQASIEADLTRNFKAQAEVGDDAQGKFILKWEKDY